MTELVTFGETALQFAPPGRQRLETATELEVHAHGTESSAAVAAARLGASATWLSTLPDVPLGRRVVAELRQHGIATDVTWTGGDRLGLSFAEAGSPPRPDGRWHDRTGTAAATTTPADVPMDLVQRAEVVFAGMGTPALSASAADTAAAIVRAGQAAGAVTVADLDYEPERHGPDPIRRSFERIAEPLDVLLAHEDGVRAVLEVEGRPRELANALVAEYDLATVAIRRTGGGAIALHDSPGSNVVYERDPPATEVVDSRGRRAAFAGGFLHGLIGDPDPARALTDAVAAAAVAVTVPGPLLSSSAEEIKAVADRVDETGR